MATSKSGLTLSEIVVAMVILSTVSLAVIGLFTHLLSSGGKQANQGTAQRLADSILTRAVREGPPDWGMNGVRHGEAELKTQNSESTTTFLYDLDTEEVKSEVASVGALNRVSVQVSWWPESSGAKQGGQGQGKMSVKLEQLVYLGK